MDHRASTRNAILNVFCQMQSGKIVVKPQSVVGRGIGQSNFESHIARDKIEESELKHRGRAPLYIFLDNSVAHTAAKAYESQLVARASAGTHKHASIVSLPRTAGISTKFTESSDCFGGLTELTPSGEKSFLSPQVS